MNRLKTAVRMAGLLGTVERMAVVAAGVVALAFLLITGAHWAAVVILTLSTAATTYMVVVELPAAQPQEEGETR